MRNNKGSVTNKVATKTPEQDRYNTFLRSTMHKKLFEIGSVLNELVCTEFKVSSAYARQILKRAVEAKAIKSSSPYTFGNGQYIYLANNQSLTTSSVMEICQTTRPPIYRLLKFMMDHAGIISYYDALKITATVIEPSSTKVTSLQDIIKVLIKLNIVAERDYNGVHFFVLIDWYDLEIEVDIQTILAKEYSRMVLDCSLLPDILRWLRKSNIISNESTSYRNKKAPSIGIKHNNIIWDAVAYTKTTGLNNVVGAKATNKEKQTLVVLDVVLSEAYDHVHLDGFLGRVQININSVKKGNRKVIPVIVYRTCSQHVLNQISVLGFIAFDIGSIFGSHIYSVLQKLSKIDSLINIQNNIEDNVTSILKTIRSSGQEDALKDLKGTLFEFLMYPVILKIFGSSNIERNRIYKTKIDGKTYSYEYDYIVYSDNPRELIVIELKGYHSEAQIPLGDSQTKATLRWFFRRTIPFIQEKLKERLADNRIFKAVYITSANFDDDGHKFLDKLNLGSLKPKNSNVGYDRLQLVSLLEEYGFENEKKAIEKYYSTDADYEP